MTATSSEDKNLDQAQSLELDGIPDFIREKLLDIKTNIDNLETIFSQIDAQSVKDLQSQNRIKSYLTRINEISEKEENPDAFKNKLKLDKQSSARIIKRSLWANASNKKLTGKTKVNDLVNATLESGAIIIDDSNDDGNSEHDSGNHVDKKLKA